MNPDSVSERPFWRASFGKNGAIMDIEQKLMKSTRASNINVNFCLLLNVFSAEGSKCDFDLKSAIYFITYMLTLKFGQ